jgi:y4mF family transcriptional regulator
LTLLRIGANVHPKGSILRNKLPEYEDATAADILLGSYNGDRRVYVGNGGLLQAGQVVRVASTEPVTSVADLAPLIRKARKDMKMNQQAFADAAGVGRRFLSELENGKPSLEFDKVLTCALAAGIDIIAKPRRPL